FHFKFKFAVREKKFFDPKIRRIREAVTTKTNLKLNKYEIRKQSVAQRLMINATMHMPFAWFQDNNDSMWNETEFNTTFTNVTIILAGHKDNLIFGYFRLYALILLAILVILLFVMTTIACYYDCENRRSHLLGGKYDMIKKDTVPKVTIKYEGKEPDIIDKKKIRDVRIYHSVIFWLILCNIVQISYNSY
uniref:Conserved plasma membrane protein n=1 Tax=Elaeophora elaphi TaxID=1147741 RepID=A0A0R3RY57_9BILA